MWGSDIELDNTGCWKEKAALQWESIVLERTNYHDWLGYIVGAAEGERTFAKRSRKRITNNGCQLQIPYATSSKWRKKNDSLSGVFSLTSQVARRLDHDQWRIIWKYKELAVYRWPVNTKGKKKEGTAGHMGGGRAKKGLARGYSRFPQRIYFRSLVIRRDSTTRFCTRNWFRFIRSSCSDGTT